MNITDKEMLLEELEEHLQQVKDCMIENPFTMLDKLILLDSIEAECYYNNSTIHFVSNKLEKIETFKQLV